MSSKLRNWRMETARTHNVPAYIIFHDATMREIAKAQPQSQVALRGVSGVGEKKLETYGDEIDELITTIRSRCPSRWAAMVASNVDARIRSFSASRS